MDDQHPPRPEAPRPAQDVFRKSEPMKLTNQEFVRQPIRIAVKCAQCGADTKRQPDAVPFQTGHRQSIPLHPSGHLSPFRHSSPSFFAPFFNRVFTGVWFIVNAHILHLAFADSPEPARILATPPRPVRGRHE